MGSEKNQQWWKTAKAKKVGVAGLGAALLGVVVWWFAYYPFVSTEDARIAMTLVRVAPSVVGGRVEKILVQEGDRVTKGQVLIEIEHEISQAGLDKADAENNLAQKELIRMQALARSGSATGQMLDKAKALAAKTDADLALARNTLENTYLRSLFDGVVVQKIAEVGNILERNQPGVVVADDRNAWVSANIEETSVGSVRLGQEVAIDVDEGGVMSGKVLEIRQSVASQFALIPSDSGSGNFTKVVQRVPIKIEITKRNDLVLRAGQSVEIKIRVH